MKTTTVYLLCFAPGLPRNGHGPACHYLGSTSLSAEDRLAIHLSGRGSPLVYAAHKRGLRVRLVRTWTGDKRAERHRKAGHHLARLCPICNPKLAVDECSIDMRHSGL